MYNRFNHKRYKRPEKIERNTYYYATSIHCGVDIRYAPVVEMPKSYEKRMRELEKIETWKQFIKSQVESLGCHTHCNLCDNYSECLYKFDKAFVAKFKYNEAMLNSSSINLNVSTESITYTTL